MFVEILAAETVDPVLRQAQFKKKSGRLTWNRKRGDFVDVVNIQKDIKGGRYDSFTINVGVFVPEMHEMVWGVKRTGFISEARCTVRTRIGPLMQGELSQPYGTDVWWDLDSQADLERVSNEIGNALKDKVLPFLDQFRTIRDVHRLMVNAPGSLLIGSWEGRLYHVIARHRVGDSEGARAMLEEFKRKDWWSEHCERVRVVLGY